VFNLKRTLALLLALLIALPARAQEQMNVVRDAEIESTLHYFARPIFLAARLKPEDVRIILIDSPDVNAFVAGGMNMFIFTQLILMTDTPQQLIGVMAHETGHIAGGHLARRGEGEENAEILAIIGTVIGMGAAMGSRGTGDAAGGMVGGEALGEASILSFSRTQEASADQAGITFLERSGMSPLGLYQFLAKLMGTEAMPESREVEYTRTHPLTQDRVEAVKYATDRWGVNDKHDLPEMQFRYDMMKAKLMGYLEPAEALRKYGKSEKTLWGRYGRAYALYRSNQTDAALKLMDQLIAEQPEDPYFYEFKGQMLFESGKGEDAVAPYRLAVKYANGNGLIDEEAAHAIIEANQPGTNDEAIGLLDDALKTEKDDPFIHHLLATAYGRQDNMGEVHLQLAEEASLNDDAGLARREARLAMGLTPVGSREYLAAQDIIDSGKPLKSDGSIDDSKMKRQDKDQGSDN
jgi:predicted Zn-dependent protease